MWHRETYNGLYYAVGDFGGKKPIRRKLCLALGCEGTNEKSAEVIRRLNSLKAGEKWQKIIDEAGS